MSSEISEEDLRPFRKRKNSINSRLAKRLNLTNKTTKSSKSKITFNTSNLTTKQEIILMLKKHIIIYSRNVKSLLFIFLTPIFFMYMLQAMQYLTDNYKNKSVILNYPITKIDNLDLNCHNNLNITNCISLGIIVLGNLTEKQNKELDYLIESISNKTNLPKKEIEIIGKNFSNQNEFYKIFDKKNNTKYYNYIYQYIISFCYGNFQIGNLSIPCRPEIKNEDYYLYTIVYNISNTPNAFLSGYNSPYPIDEKLIKLQKIIDNSYIELFNIKYNNNSENNIPKINNISIQPYPSVHSRFLDNANVISSFGSFYFYFPPMILFSIILLDIVKEKESKLKHFTILNGMSLISYWISWCIVSFIFSLLLTIEILFMGYIIFKYDIFTNVNPIISFSLFFLFNLSLMFLSMMISNYVNSLNTATTISYSVIIIGIVIQTVLTNYTIMYFLYATKVNDFLLYIMLKILSLFMHFYPPFIFTKCYVDIISISSSHFDYDLFQWIPGRYYSFNDIFIEYKGKLLIGIEYKIDSFFQTFLWFYISIFFYIIAISFKEIRDYYGKMKNKKNSIRKSSSSSYLEDDTTIYYFDYYYSLFIDFITIHFPKIFIKYNPIIYLKKFYDTNFNYRKSNKRRNQIENSLSKSYENFLKLQEIPITEQSNLIIHDTDISVIEEKKKIALLHRKRQPPNGIRILQINRKYKNNNGEIIEAINDINLDILKGESFALLGPNGSGKTTLINLLSCQLKANKGYAKIGPFIIHSEMFIDSLYIKKMIGVCSQFDLFWEEMTVMETISFFAYLKGVILQKTIYDKIIEFGLNGKENERINCLSGGMRRRVSLLISTLGDPYILYLDEPTTGLDPVNKRKIWKIINEFKKNKVLILSTQNIEEADFLCDRIGVLINGKLMFIGSSFDILKINSNYFEMQICLNLHKMNFENRQNLDDYIKILFCKSIIKYNTSGVYTIQIPLDCKEEILKGMEMVNKKSSNEKINFILNFVKDVVVSQANLEKSFIDLCHKFQ